MAARQAPAWRAALFVADFYGGAGAGEREGLEVAGDGDAGGNVADGFVAGLIFELAGDGESFAVFGERAPEFGAGADADILGDAEGAFEDGDLLFDRGQIKSFGRRINRGLEFELRDGFHHQLDGLVTLRAGGVDVDIRRETNFGNERDARAGNAGEIGLFESELQMRGFERCGDFLA